ncbi:MAG: M23 family metallopeptidase [Clostridia bacterium]|nr:M23 family metallopeptidase [Clostridia bacterium]
MNDNDALIVEFPLRGEWVAPNTPGDKIPSHGTDVLGQTFAFDFIQTDIRSQKGMKFYKSNAIRYWTLGIPLNDCYCYREPIYSPVDGRVVVACDGVGEPRYLHPVAEIIKSFFRTAAISVKALFQPMEKIKLDKFIGNHVIIEFGEYYAFFAHFSPGTIKVKEGEDVKIGDIIGGVGHSGNSTAPHLHFHIMDSPDLLKAKGVLCAFRKYIGFFNGEWEEVKNRIPKGNERIRL